MSDRTFDELVNEALEAPFEGWDFSYLEGRRVWFTLPWDYAARVKARMQDTTAMLDMGTGGGEFIASLAPLPPRVRVTETYEPNVAVARRRLEPLGVTVCDTSDDPDNEHLPFDDGEFDLVINRHESYVPAEITRILKPGGTFITQQVGTGSEHALVEFFKGTYESDDWTSAVTSRQLAEAGLTILEAQDVSPEYAFLDVGAVVYFLTAIPWILDDFTVDRYRDRLLAMHDHIRRNGPFTLKAQRFFVEAVKPR